jgi:hypothetical protein
MLGDELVDEALAIPLPNFGLAELPAGRPKRTKRCMPCASHAGNRRACANLKKVGLLI